MEMATTRERRRCLGSPRLRLAADGDALHLPRVSSGARRYRCCSSCVIFVYAATVFILGNIEATQCFPLAASKMAPRRTGAVIFGASTSELRREATSSPTSDELFTEDAATTATTTETFVMPIFPLRKSVRVPTQSLTLNLYEPRYVALAERVLYGGGDCSHEDDARRVGGGGADRPARPQHHRRMFGALYCSSKTQIVRDGGQGPIVPLVEVGDVGAVCDVLDHSDTVRGDGSRKISIRALAVGRFRVESILSDGYSQRVVRTSRNNDVGNPIEDIALPYILVEASRVDDVVPPAGSDEEVDLIEAEELLFRSMLDAEGEGDVAAFWGGGSDVEEDEVFLAANRLAPSGVVDERGDGGGRVAENDATTAASREERSLRAWSSGLTGVDSVGANGGVPWPPSLEEHRRRELYSFAMLAALVSDKPRPAVEVETLLRVTSTRERLDFVLRFMDEGRWWRRLFGWL